MKIIEGNVIAQKIKDELKIEVEKLASNGIVPTLAIILVGNNSASEIYVRNKLKACTELGIKANLYRFDENIDETLLINNIRALNNDINIDGIIVQCPLLNHFNENKILQVISNEKDVDGFGIQNLGYLASDDEHILAATPQGIIKVLEYENIDIAQKYIVIVGRSKIVGRPLALALLNRDATVTICHSKTINLKEITKKADILVSAIGCPNFFNSDFIKDGAIVIDVGINRVDGKICGDVDFNSVKDKVSYITPVPKGIGPMTIAMLLTNVVKVAKKRGENKNG